MSTNRTSKRCTLCLMDKPYDAFHRAERASGQRTPRHGFGVTSWCKACKSHQRNPRLIAKRQQRALLDAAELKTCNICRQVKPYGDFPRRRKSPDGLSYTCRLCAKQRTIRWKKAHPGAHATWYQENREHKKQYWVEWRGKNAERLRENYRRWARANTSRVNALHARRHATKLQATPKWADHAAIRAIYQEALRLTRETGIRHEVDHIVPLRSHVVCGLHVAANLQILTSAANKKKSNHLSLAA